MPLRGSNGFVRRVGERARTGWCALGMLVAFAGNGGAPELRGAEETPTTASAATPATEASQPELGLSEYEPVYFSIGFNERRNARFQFSVKYRPFGSGFSETEMRAMRTRTRTTGETLPGKNVWNDIYAAYSQTSLWDLESESRPFFDSSYRPSVFWLRSGFGGVFNALQIGYEHESNGKGEADSRSVDLFVVRPVLQWDLGDDWVASFAPKFYLYIDREENPDIAEYRGYGDYLISLERGRDWKFSAGVRLGTAGRASVLVDAALPFSRTPPFAWLGFKHGWLHLQYFDGYGESLLSYRQRGPWQVRAGVMLVR